MKKKLTAGISASGFLANLVAVTAMLLVFSSARAQVVDTTKADQNLAAVI